MLAKAVAQRPAARSVSLFFYTRNGCSGPQAATRGSSLILHFSFRICARMGAAARSRRQAEGCNLASRRSARAGPSARLRAPRKLRPEFHFILRSVGRSSPQMLHANRLLDHRGNAFSKIVSQATNIKISLPALRLLDRKFVFRIFAPTYFLRQYPKSVVYCRTITNFAELSVGWRHICLVKVFR